MALAESGCEEGLTLLRRLANQGSRANGAYCNRRCPGAPRSSIPGRSVAATKAASSHPRHSQVRFWVAAAAAGWDGPEVEGFLRACANDGLADTRRAAMAALQKTYIKWNPL